MLVTGALLTLAAPAFGVLSGRNGRIAFTSGREGANDNLAQIFTINPINPQLGLTGPLSIPGVQNRHASWSPDRTKLVFASGTPGPLGGANDEEYDLFVRDLTANPPTTTALDQANQVGDNLSSDHPAWSPDGTKIAYETQPDDPGDDSFDRDIMVKTVNTAAAAVPLANTANFELKPAWSPDSQEIYYATSPTPPPGATQFDIVKKASTAAAATAPTNVLAVNTVDEYQPSISPDGSKICYTRQTTLGGTGTADVLISDLPGGGNTKDISDNVGAANGDINCTFSPDGLKVAFTQGTFSAGKLMTENVNENDNTPPLVPLTDDMGSNNFDGNSDWAPDGSPDCPDSTVTTPRNTAITLNLECTDTGPAYERTDPNGSIANNGSPANGTVSDHSPLTNPSTLKYTPNQNFTGTDSIKFVAFDAFGFGTDTGTITINVQAPGGGGGGNGGGANAANTRCGARTATIVGTSGNDTIRGTSGADVIVGLGGNDRITGLGGRDRICGGSGRDRIGGGSGNDRIAGGSGNDRVGGNSGNDSLKGESGNDSVSGGSGNDNMSGGGGSDKLGGGPGRDRLNGAPGRTG